MTDDATPQPKIGQQSPRQDNDGLGGLLGPAIGNTSSLIPFAGFAGACSAAGGAIGTNGLNNFGTYGIWNAVAAVVGTGTLEGTNKYGGGVGVLGGGMGIGVGGLPGFGLPLPGTYTNYRIMASFPTAAIAIRDTWMPVVGAEWSYRATDEAPEGAKEFVEKVMSPLRLDLMQNAVRATLYGSQAFERVYAADGSNVILKCLKPLLPDLTEYKVNPDGSFGGLVNGGVTLGPENCWVYTYDKEGDNYYGRSRMENCRRAWSNFLATEDNGAQLARKTAGIIPQVFYPPGGGIDEQGKPITNLSIARTVLSGVSRGQGVLLPNFGAMNEDDLRGSPDLTKQSLFKVDMLDAGNPGPFMDSLLEWLNYYDKQIVRGWFKAERSLLEAQRGGSRADSESHGDVGTADASMLLDDIVRRVNETIVDDLLALNFGEEYRGTVRIEPTPIIDAEKEIDTAIMTGIAANAPLFIKLMGEIDKEALFKRRGIPIREDIDPNEDGWDQVQAQLDAKDAAKNQPPQPGGKPKANDASAMLSRWLDGD